MIVMETKKEYMKPGFGKTSIDIATAAYGGFNLRNSRLPIEGSGTDAKSALEKYKEAARNHRGVVKFLFERLEKGTEEIRPAARRLLIGWEYLAAR